VHLMDPWCYKWTGLYWLKNCWAPPWCRRHRILTIILRNRADYRLILSRRGRRLKSPKIRWYSARWSRIIVLLFNKLITKLTILSGQEKNFYFACLACCGVQNYVYRRISVTTDIERIMTIFGQCDNLLNNKSQ